MGIKQIAKLANVSIGTVDRVLHKRSGVSKETEKKVLKIIKETGYTKNTTASRLKLAAVNKIKIAILLPKGKNKWSYWKLPQKGIKRAIKELKELGVEADFFDFHDSLSFNMQREQIFEEDYDAIVTVPFFKNSSNILLHLAKSKEIPVVFLDTEIAVDSPAYFIRQNSHNAGMVAGRLLHGLVGNDGLYFIVNIINDKGIHANGQQREDGFRTFFETIEEQVNIHTINHPINAVFAITKEMEEWFKKETPKGIFVTNSRAHLVAQILKEHNVANTFVVGFDMNEKNVACLKNDEIDFIINQQPEYQGYSAIKGIFNFLTKNDASELYHDIHVEIIVKENIPTTLDHS
ncbi:MAG: LacI family DNA-binding transcriptional regulator [Eudoraea sp.]|nr:LacI family DNA-binding transcriptional regulator [Eudoraea sp.]